MCPRREALAADNSHWLPLRFPVRLSDSPALLPQLVELTCSPGWALAARQAIDRIPRDKLWPVLTPIIDAKMATTDPGDLRRLAELLAHWHALPLLEKLVARARGIDDPQAREVADDFTDQYRLFWSLPPEPAPTRE